MKERTHTAALRLFSVALSAALICIMSLSATLNVSAADIPSSSDKATATVQNVESGAEVYAYQITEAVYNSNGFIRYKAVDGVTLADPTAPTSDEVGLISQNTSGLTSVRMTANESGDYVADLAPGYWIVLVKGTGSTIYNPMLAGVYYSVSGSDNTMVSEPIDAGSMWTLETENAYAKKDTPDVDKSIVNPGSGNSNGDDVAVGDHVSFSITSTIPSYSPRYTSVVFNIKDELGNGLSFDRNTVVKVGGETVSSPNVAVTYEGQNMLVSFASDFILANGLKNVEVTYTATLTDNAGVNFDSNNNTATLEYTHNPGETKEGAGDTAHVYTFGIDANLNGSGSDTTSEITKTGVTNTTQQTTEPLKDAEFTLTNNTTNKQYVAVTDSDGHLSFKGLDAGTYTLVETAAPAGYAISSTEHSVVITAEYNADGTLKTYSITIDGEATSTYTATYDADGTITTIDKTQQGTEIINTPIPEMPSTGGIGTALFTFGGLAVMVLAAMMLRRNKQE